MTTIFRFRLMNQSSFIFIALLILLQLSTFIASGQTTELESLDENSTNLAPVFVDDFNDNNINQNWWSDYNLGDPTVGELNQQLEIDIPSTSTGSAFYAGISSKFRVRGDFDIEVEYKLLTWPQKNGLRVGIIPSVLSFSPHRVSCGNGESCVDVYLVNNNGILSPTIDASSHNDGKFRMTRQGNLVTAYYYDPDSTDWVQISSASKGTEDIKFSLQAWSHDSYFIDQDVSIAFDNFRVNEGQVIVSEIFVPLVVRE